VLGCLTKPFWRAHEAILGRLETGLKHNPDMVERDPTTGCDHVGIHRQLGLRAVLREISGRRAEAPAPVGLKTEARSQ
jgi:hypothetical protein